MNDAMRLDQLDALRAEIERHKAAWKSVLDEILSLQKLNSASDFETRVRIAHIIKSKMKLLEEWEETK